MTGDRVAVLAAAPVWLVMLGFPVAYAVSGTASGVALGVALAALTLLVGVYLRAALRIARFAAPRPAPLSLMVVAVVAIALPSVVGTAWFGGTVFLAALLGLSLPARRALIGIAAATGLAVGQAVLIDVASPQTISVPLVTAVAGAIVVVVVRQSVLTRELTESRRTTKRLAVEAERLRLARELHDSVKQQAFVAALELASARTRLGPDQHLAAAAAVATVQRQLGEVIEQVPPPQRELLAALPEHLAEWSRRTGVTANLTVHPAQVLPAEDLAAEPLLTVAAEALTNVARHTGASQVAVTLSRRDGRAVLEIADDGLGVDVQRTPFGHRRSYPGRGARMAPRRAPPRDRSLTGRGTDPPSRDRAHAGDITRMTRATQVLSLLLVALTMRLEFAHTLELGPKLNYSPELGCCGGGPGGCSPERH